MDIKDTQGWIKINSEEDLPKEEKEYLVYYIDLDGGHMKVMKLLKWANCFDWAAHMYSGWKDLHTITHWRELPSEPEKIEETKKKCLERLLDYIDNY